MFGLNIQIFGIIIQSKSRYLAVLRSHFKMGRHEGLEAGMQIASNMANTTDRTGDDEFLVRLDKATEDLKKRRDLLNGFPVLREAQDIVDRSGF